MYALPVSQEVDRSARGRCALCVCLALTLLFAIGRLVYASTLPVPVDVADGAFRLLMSSTIIVLTSVRVVAKWRALKIIARAIAILSITKTELMTSVVFIYWTGRNWPLVDNLLAQADKLVGFDWLTYIRWIDVHWFFIEPLYFAYESIWWQPTVIVLLLAYIGRADRAFIFVTATGASLFIVSGISMCLPAYGAYTHFGASLTLFPHLTMGDLGNMRQPIDHLRAGIFNPADLNVPLVQFPSFHATEAALMIWASWVTRVRWLALALNLAMLAATPVFGSHYLVDMIAGVGVAAMTLWFIFAAVAIASAIPVPKLRITEAFVRSRAGMLRS